MGIDQPWTNHFSRAIDLHCALFLIQASDLDDLFSCYRHIRLFPDRTLGIQYPAAAKNNIKQLTHFLSILSFAANPASRGCRVCADFIAAIVIS